MFLFQYYKRAAYEKSVYKNLSNIYTASLLRRVTSM